ncbi:MAG: (deoxy)nucleoside triphosphate pyrophosphohydrolase [Verrucomicrobia bacterium]|nr:(deoxy)nucleoside triphosphate pyrophosphohydrolase [Verrucomicrobiota bacterium]MBT4275505.1 (deoxy)nucleoside triphosphate pyrophosphohydrolase [Verrucomicrobiota bacterium]MBT5061750.1 (deoxy)nucleoside triphosphate pyrophosphohydrolase [Verrucomicrobiota bacterium]MBT5479735.1 (deoxy)nucleoside triphosphate pyrophosphohydrolase [Verrucomicrobiota bacterium]MBT6237561.1 (deoxy)nucleoside triphosphate pyrophosphohydrolase [Verrucomicrobiota bacterium]
MRKHTAVEVAAALVFRNEKLLIARRPSGVHLAGLWEFPGGKREQGESFESCLQREIWEELDCGITVGSLVFKNVHSYSEKTVDIRFYHCKLTQGEPRAIECDALEWITKDQVADYSFPEADVALLEYLDRCPHLWV